MNALTFEDKITQIYCEIDESCKCFDVILSKNGLGSKPKRTSSITISELSTILVLYHLSGYKCFKAFYLKFVQSGSYARYFGTPLSYNRLIELIPRTFIYLNAYMIYGRCIEESGIYYMDSKKIVVCHNRRIHSNKVF